MWTKLLGLARAVDARSYYQLLGVTMDAVGEELRRAYLERTSLIDRFPRAGAEARKHRNALLLLKGRLREAHDVLGDAALRRRYDERLARGELRLAGLEVGSTALDRVREEPRTPFSALVRVSCAKWSDFLNLHANNISRGGLFVKTATPLERGAAVKLRIVLPQQFTLELDAEVVRSVKGAVPGMGLAFLPMDDFRKSIVERLVREAREDAAAAAIAAIESLDAESIHDIDDADVLGVEIDLESSAVELAAPAALEDEHETSRYERPAAIPVAKLAFEDLFSRPVALIEPGEVDHLDHDERVSEARRLLAERRFAEARACFAQAMRSNRRDLSLRAGFHLAAAYEAKQEGRADDAHEHFERVLIFDKHCHEAIRELRN